MCLLKSNCLVCSDAYTTVIAELETQTEEVKKLASTYCIFDRCPFCKSLYNKAIAKPIVPSNKYFITFTQTANGRDNYETLCKCLKLMQSKYRVLQYVFELTKAGNPHLHVQCQPPKGKYPTKDITSLKRANGGCIVDIQRQKGSDDDVSNYFSKDIENRKYLEISLIEFGIPVCHINESTQ